MGAENVIQTEGVKYLRANGQPDLFGGLEIL